MLCNDHTQESQPGYKPVIQDRVHSRVVSSFISFSPAHDPVRDHTLHLVGVTLVSFFCFVFLSFSLSLHSLSFLPKHISFQVLLISFAGCIYMFCLFHYICQCLGSPFIISCLDSSSSLRNVFSFSPTPSISFQNLQFAY